MTELSRLSDVLKEHGLDFNSFIELSRDRDIQVLVEIPSYLDGYRVDASPNPGRGLVIKEESYRFVTLVQSQLEALALKGEVEIFAAETLQRFDAGRWLTINANDIYHQDLARALKDKCEMAQDLASVRMYGDSRSIPSIKQFRFFHKDREKAGSSEPFVVTEAMLWLHSRYGKEFQSDLVARADVEAIRKVVSLYPKIFENDVHDLKNLTYQRRPFFGGVDETKLKKDIAEKGNIPPDVLLSMLVIAFKYYDHARPGEAVKQYRAAMMADLQKKDYWVRGSVFKAAKTKHQWACIFFTTRYASYPEKRDIEDSENYQTETKDLVKPECGDHMEAFHQSGAGLLAEVWLKLWKGADLARFDHGVWLKDKQKYRELQSVTEFEIEAMSAPYLGKAFSVELARTRAWQTLLESNG